MRGPFSMPQQTGHTTSPSGGPVSTPPRQGYTAQRRGEGRLAGDTAGLLARLAPNLHRTARGPGEPAW